MVIILHKLGMLALLKDGLGADLDHESNFF